MVASQPSGEAVHDNIDVQSHLIKEHTKIGDITFQYVPTMQNVVDMLMKALPRNTLWKFTDLMCYDSPWTGLLTSGDDGCH